jgi:hypothetical protein
MAVPAALIILLDRLVCRAYGEQALKRRSAKIHRSQPACRQHQRPRCSLRIIGMLWTGMPYRRHRCWLCPSANVPQVPQVHQSCVRTDLSTVRQKLPELCDRFHLNPKAIIFPGYISVNNLRLNIGVQC